MITFPLVAVLLATLEPATVATPAPQVARVHVSPNSPRHLGFDWDGKSTSGQVHPVPVLRVVLVYTNPVLAGATITVVYESMEQLDTTRTKIPLKDALVGVPSGDWDVTAALEDVAGNRGPPSLVTDKSRLTVTADPPTAPQSVGVVD